MTPPQRRTQSERLAAGGSPQRPTHVIRRSHTVGPNRLALRAPKPPPLPARPGASPTPFRLAPPAFLPPPSVLRPPPSALILVLPRDIVYNPRNSVWQIRPWFCHALFQPPKSTPLHPDPPVSIGHAARRTPPRTIAKPLEKWQNVAESGRTFDIFPASVHRCKLGALRNVNVLERNRHPSRIKDASIGVDLFSSGHDCVRFRMRVERRPVRDPATSRFSPSFMKPLPETIYTSPILFARIRSDPKKDSSPARIIGPGKYPPTLGGPSLESPVPVGFPHGVTTLVRDHGRAVGYRRGVTTVVRPVVRTGNPQPRTLVRPH
jgi:hypothetical protein